MREHLGEFRHTAMCRVLGANLASAIGFGVTAQSAEAVPVRCDTCRSDGDYRAEAVRMGPGTHLVYNVGANVVQQYYVGPNTSGGGGDGQEPPAARAAGPVARKQTPPSAAVEGDSGHTAAGWFQQSQETRENGVRTGMASPASEYCVKRGGKVVIEKDGKGDERGICHLPNGDRIDEWELFRRDAPRKPS